MKTVQQLVDENPDATPEQITELMTQQPYVAAMPSAPKGPASMLPDRVNLSGGEKPEGFYGLGLTQTRDTNKEMNLGVGQPDAPEMPAPKEEKPKETAMQVDVAATPPRVSEQARVAKLYADRNNLEEGLQKDIEREEDSIRETKGSVGTESALAAGGKVLAGTLGKMLNYDASPQVKGFEDAEKSIAGRTDENKQRREFLKERLYRADNPTKRMLDDLKARGAVRDNSLAEEIDPLKRQNAVADAEADILDNENRYAKGQEVGAKYNTNSADYKLNKIKQKSQLSALAKNPGPNQEMAQKLLENEAEMLAQVGPDNYDAMTKGIFDADKNGQKWIATNYKKGDDTGVMLHESGTGQVKDLGFGKTTPKVGSGRTGKQIIDDELRRAYEKEYGKGVRDPLTAVAQTRRMFEIAKTNPEAVGVLQYNIARSIAGETGPLSNQDVQRAALASPQIVDGILQTLETRGFGALTDGQKDTLQRLLDASDEHLKTKSGQIKGRYQVRAGEVGANERYIFGEDGPSAAPSAPASPSVEPKKLNSADELPEL